MVSDPPGNGLSATPVNVEQMEERVLIDQEWAVLDAVAAEQAVLAGVCTGAGHALLMAADAPERVLGVCAIIPGLRLTAPLPHLVAYDFDAPRATYEGWQKQNRHHWSADWHDFAAFFFAEVFPETHSTEQREDCVAWAMVVGPETMLLEYASAHGMAGGQHVVIEGDGHLPQARDPVMVNLQLRDFLAMLPSGPGRGAGGLAHRS